MAAVSLETREVELPKTVDATSAVSSLKFATDAIEGSKVAVVATWDRSVEAVSGVFEEANIQFHMFYYSCSRDEAITYLAFASQWGPLASSPQRVVALETLVTATMFNDVTAEPKAGKEIGKKVIIIDGKEEEIGLDTNIREWVKENCFKDDATETKFDVHTLVWGALSLRKVQTRKVDVDLATAKCSVDNSQKDALASVPKLTERGISEVLAERLARVE